MAFETVYRSGQGWWILVQVSKHQVRSIALDIVSSVFSMVDPYHEQGKTWGHLLPKPGAQNSEPQKYRDFALWVPLIWKSMQQPTIYALSAQQLITRLLLSIEGKLSKKDLISFH